MTIQPIDSLQETIHYEFKNPYLLQCALTHTSYANEQRIHTYDDYERLEFLGDSILEMVSSVFLYNKYPGKREGEMTKIRASLVCEPALAYCARDIGLENYIRLGKGEEAGGGRDKDSIISDVMEAVIGAMYLDSGSVDAPQQFILSFILSDLEGKLLFYDAKSILQEELQRTGRDVSYAVISEDGPSHMRIYTVALYVNGVEIGRGSGRSKKAAEQDGAYKYLKAQREHNNK